MAKKKLACASCGMAVKKMKKGGSAPKPFAAGIPYAAGAGQTDGKNGMMKKGGSVKRYAKGGSADSCPKGQYWDGTACVSNASPKIAAGILGAGMAALGTRIGQNIKANKPVRQAKKAAKTMANDIAKKKMGGSLKPVPSGNKGLAKLPTAVRNKMGYQKRGGTVKRK